jgi:hypothetical protein
MMVHLAAPPAPEVMRGTGGRSHHPEGRAMPPLSRDNLPRIAKAIEELCRVIEHPPTGPEWDLDHGQPFLIREAAKEVWRSIAPHRDVCCPEISDAQLAPPVKEALIELRGKLLDCIADPVPDRVGDCSQAGERLVYLQSVAYMLRAGHDPMQEQGGEGSGARSRHDPGAEVLPPSLLSAFDLARRLNVSTDAVDAWLRRYRERYPDCYTETEGRRKNEPRYLYHTSDVLPEMRRHFRMMDD